MFNCERVCQSGEADRFVPREDVFPPAVNASRMQGVNYIPHAENASYKNKTLFPVSANHV